MVYSARRFVVCLTLCHFVLVLFSFFSIAITSLGEERANLSDFRMFDRFVLVLDLSVSSFSWCLGRAAVCDFGTPWTFTFFLLLFVALWFILQGDLFYFLPCVILLLCFSVLLALRLPRLGKRELILVIFVRLFDLCLFGFVGFLFLSVSGKGCGLWLWHSLDFSLTFFESLK